MMAQTVSPLVLIGFAMMSMWHAGAQDGRPAARKDTQHVVVWKQPERFGGWPANHGMWSWGDEIVVGHRAGHFKQVERGHAIDRDKPSEEWQARSVDGGLTWVTEKPPSIVPPHLGGRKPMACPGNLDFAHPDMALMFRMTSANAGESRFYYSNDRARTWQGPYELPNFGQPGIAARTDYIVNSRHDLVIFVTAAKQNGREGRVLMARTLDGGKSWEFVSWIGPEPDGYSIMPSSVRLSPTRLLTTIRRKEGKAHWIDAWASGDNGSTWQWLNRPGPVTTDSMQIANAGNPPSLLSLRDGRLAMIYGYRNPPYGIRAKLSDDGGITWSQEIVLRADAGGWDIGYPVSVQRSDGRIVSVYYYNDHPDEERYIAATIWDPDPKTAFGGTQ